MGEFIQRPEINNPEQPKSESEHSQKPDGPTLKAKAKNAVASLALLLGGTSIELTTAKEALAQNKSATRPRMVKPGTGIEQPTVTVVDGKGRVVVPARPVDIYNPKEAEQGPKNDTAGAEKMAENVVDLAKRAAAKAPFKGLPNPSKVKEGKRDFHNKSQKLDAPSSQEQESKPKGENQPSTSGSGNNRPIVLPRIVGPSFANQAEKGIPGDLEKKRRQNENSIAHGMPPEHKIPSEETRSGDSQGARPAQAERREDFVNPPMKFRLDTSSVNRLYADEIKYSVLEALDGFLNGVRVTHAEDPQPNDNYLPIRVRPSITLAGMDDNTFKNQGGDFVGQILKDIPVVGPAIQNRFNKRWLERVVNVGVVLEPGSAHVSQKVKNNNDRRELTNLMRVNKFEIKMNYKVKFAVGSRDGMYDIKIIIPVDGQKDQEVLIRDVPPSDWQQKLQAELLKVMMKNPEMLRRLFDFGNILNRVGEDYYDRAMGKSGKSKAELLQEDLKKVAQIREEKGIRI